MQRRTDKDGPEKATAKRLVMTRTIASRDEKGQEPKDPALTLLKL